MSHNPNPFDFVPFANTPPVTKTVEEWFATGKLVTGWIECKITALTPVHIIGKQEVNTKGTRIIRSHFYRRHGKAFIPGSSIRGMLRSFIEAACNCWVSQVNTYYPRKYKERQIGFMAVDLTEIIDKKEFASIDKIFLQNKIFAIPKDFYPPFTQTDDQANSLKIDLASLLFGYIPPKGNGFRGRLIIEDVLLDSSNIAFDDNSYYVPDIESKAFMGGGKPSSSSWWYQRPFQIRFRKTSRNREVVDFVGIGYRGRKFYYHQQPQSCVDWYFNPNNWPHSAKRPLYKIPLECLVAGKSTNTFRIYFEDLPEYLLPIVLFSLSPGKRLKHKIGFGKAYGYGTIDIEVIGGQLQFRFDGKSVEFDPTKIVKSIHNVLWDVNKLKQIVGDWLHWPSIKSLAKIMWYAHNSTLIFSYPPFSSDPNFVGFLPVIDGSTLMSVLTPVEKSQISQECYLSIDLNRAEELAEKLADLGKRPALNFHVYQKKSNVFSILEKRTLDIAETLEEDNL